MERRELDKQTDQPGEAGSSRQRQQDRNVPAWGHSPWSPPSPQPAQGVTAHCQGPPCSLITVSMAINGRKSNKSSSLQTPGAFPKPWQGQAGAHTHTPVAAGGWHSTHLSATRLSCWGTSPCTCGRGDGPINKQEKRLNRWQFRNHHDATRLLR